MENELVVSVQMITYGHEAHIKQAVEGVLMQETDFEFDLIIADDCSPDKTSEIINEIIKTNSKSYRIKYFRHIENIGIQKNGIFSLSKCMGKYIALCEGDDYWTDPDKLQKQVDFLEANVEYGLVFTDVSFYFQDKDKIIKSVFNNGIIKHKINFYWQLIHTGYFAPCTWVCRREYLPNFEDKVYVDGTFPWLLDIMANSKVYFLPETTSVYRVLPESASRSKDESKKVELREGVYQIQLDYAKKYKVEKNIISIIEQRHYYNLLIDSIISNNIKSINECFDYYLTNQPILIKTIMVLELSRFDMGRKFIKLLFSIKLRM